MKVLFANPPTYIDPGTFNRPGRFPTFRYGSKIMTPPLHLVYAVSYVRSKGHDVSFIDAQVDGLTVDEFVKQAGDIKPDFLVFETSTPSFKNDLKVAADTKAHTGCKVVFLGPHVTSTPAQSILNNPVLDAVVVGEYELSLGEYLEKGGKGTLGICYRGEDGEPVLNQRRPYNNNLDALPFPARDLMQNEKYYDPILKHPYTYMLGGRGCPFQCTFCNWPQVLMGHSYRYRSATNIVDELEECVQTYGLKNFQFNDDTWTIHRRHALAICDEISKRGLKIEFAVYARADTQDRELLERMREVGCTTLKCGVESGNQQVLDNMKKEYRLEEVEKGQALMHELGYHIHCTFIFGMPGETHESIQDTINFAKKISPTTVQFSTAIPTPGTELHRYLEERGLMLSYDTDEYMPMHGIFEYPDLSFKEIAGAVKQAYRQYYFRPKYYAMGFKELFRRPKEVVINARRLMQLAF